MKKKWYIVEQGGPEDNSFFLIQATKDELFNIPEWCVEEVSDEKAVEHILAFGNIEYEIKRNGISIYKVKCDDHWYIIVKSIDELITVEEVLS